MQRMQNLSSDVNRLIKRVGDLVKQFLAVEIKIKTSSINYQFHDVQRLKLKYLTSIMAVEGQLHMLFAFSFDQPLINKIMRKYTVDIDTSDIAEEEYIEETAADMINLLLGNSLKGFSISGKTIQLTPPVVITEAKTIYRNKQAMFLTADIITHQGSIQIYCIGPEKLFDSELNYIEGNL